MLLLAPANDLEIQRDSDGIGGNNKMPLLSCICVCVCVLIVFGRKREDTEDIPLSHNCRAAPALLRRSPPLLCLTRRAEVTAPSGSFSLLPPPTGAEDDDIIITRRRQQRPRPWEFLFITLIIIGNISSITCPLHRRGERTSV